jgi:DNA-binding transcriptional MocR family regulator
LIIEDGIYDFLTTGGLSSMTAFAPERVIHITSLAKAIAPGLRIGYAAAPEGFVGRIAGGVAATTLMVPAILAETAALMIENGSGAACAERQRAEATERSRIANALLSEGQCLSPATFNTWLPLPPPWTAADFVAEARKNGVVVTPGGSFAIGKPRLEAVRVSLSAVPTRESLERGLRILAGLLRVLPEASTVTV